MSDDWAEYCRLLRAGVSPRSAAVVVLEQQRRRPRPDPGPTPAPREHGTERGWRQHRTDGTEACSDCKAAHSRHNLDRRPV